MRPTLKSPHPGLCPQSHLWGTAITQAQGLEGPGRRVLAASSRAPPPTPMGLFSEKSHDVPPKMGSAWVSPSPGISAQQLFLGRGIH